MTPETIEAYGVRLRPRPASTTSRTPWPAARLLRGWLPGPDGTRADSVRYGLLASDLPR
ncbi:hypothetical protein AB0C02_06890 [Micromonospora sp. NPDC048999]|uniref:hypothetical protein n=1 Tax=Micromonospora sp. NPDC048999 TaxID=3155391 RepID=UPI0033E7242D